MTEAPTAGILLATDGSDDAATAGRAAADLPAGTGSELHIVHAWSGYRRPGDRRRPRAPAGMAGGTMNGRP